MEDGYPEGSVLLNLGSGSIHWHGWVNVDLNPEADVVADITKLPYSDGHADVISSIHVIEHFYRWEVEDVLREWCRVLKPGGKLILECPSMEKVFQYICSMADRRLPMSATFSWWPLWGDPKYKDPAMVHKWGYTFPMLKEVLVKSGFMNVSLEKPRYHFPNRDMRVVSFKPSTTGVL